MPRFLLLSITLLALMSLSCRKSFPRTRIFKFNLSQQVKKSFSYKSVFYLYRSFITGRKRGVNKELKTKFKELNLLHLMTPSGLHFSTIMIVFFLIRRKLKHRFLDVFEFILCMSIYAFLPGYFSLRRVAFLRGLFIANDLFKSKFSKMQVFILFLVFDFFWGTFEYSPMSWFLSILFLGIIFSFQKVNFFVLSIYFYFGQMIIAFTMGHDLLPLGIIFSPLLTWIFTFIYPFLFLNIFFIKIFNYSDGLIRIYSLFVENSYYIATAVKSVHVTWPIICSVIILSRKTIYLSLGIILIGLLFAS